MATPVEKRHRALDGLRAVAIGLVFAEHFGGFLPGTLGVDVFFVLSGYLITGLLISERDRRGKVAFRSFYRRRTLRLMPAYLVMTAFTVVAAGTLGGDGSASLARQGVARSLTYTSNIATALHRWDAETPRLWEFTWSLAAEEQFYLLWPVLLVLGLRLARTEQARLLLGAFPFAGFLASTLWSYHLIAAHAPVMRIAVAPDTRSGGLLLGCAVAIWQSTLRGRPVAYWGTALARWGGLLLGVAVLWQYPRGSGYSQARLSPVMAAATALVILAVTSPGRSRSLTSTILSLRPVAFVGRLSYSLYLYNVLGLLLFEFGEQQGWIRVAHGLRPVVAALMALAMAYLSYRWVEQPFLRRRERVRPKAVASSGPARARSVESHDELRRRSGPHGLRGALVPALQAGEEIPGGASGRL
ncbi:MAG TPA: acyltransferase [Frankiaceae bacterium]|nr:acyltransferase [Frankiaceae bacterium]